MTFAELTQDERLIIEVQLLLKVGLLRLASLPASARTVPLRAKPSPA